MIEWLRNGLRSLVTGWRATLWALLSKVMRSDQLWDLVERTGIVVFVGPNGSGKSLAAVRAVVPTLYEGVPWACDELVHHHNEDARRHWLTCEDCSRTPRGRVGLCEVACEVLDVCGVGERLVYSTVPLRAPDGSDAERYRPLVDFRQLVTVEHADVLFDEVAGVSDASDSAGVPVQVTNWLHQLRKRDVRLRVTTPAYARCSKPIRQVAQVVVDARSFFPELDGSGRLWRSRQAMLYRAYDAFAFADYTPTTGDRLKSLGTAAFWRPGSVAESAYDTLGAVLALGHVTEGGMCGVCGGARSRPKCACDHSVDDVPLERLRVDERVSAAGTRTRQAVVIEAPLAVVPDDGAAEGIARVAAASGGV